MAEAGGIWAKNTRMRLMNTIRQKLAWHVTMDKSKFLRMDLLGLLMLNVFHNHVKSQLLINQVSRPTLKSHALVKVVLFILSNSAVDVVNKFIVYLFLLR
jgi:hypothetical protein